MARRSTAAAGSRRIDRRGLGHDEVADARARQAVRLRQRAEDEQVRQLLLERDGRGGLGRGADASPRRTRGTPRRRRRAPGARRPGARTSSSRTASPVGLFGEQSHTRRAALALGGGPDLLDRLAVARVACAARRRRAPRPAAPRRRTSRRSGSERRPRRPSPTAAVVTRRISSSAPAPGTIRAADPRRAAHRARRAAARRRGRRTRTRGARRTRPGHRRHGVEGAAAQRVHVGAHDLADVDPGRGRRAPRPTARPGTALTGSGRRRRSIGSSGSAGAVRGTLGARSDACPVRGRPSAAAIGRDGRGDARPRRLAVSSLDLDPAAEGLDADAAPRARGAAGRQDVVRAGGVVAGGDRRPRADEDRPRVADVGARRVAASAHCRLTCSAATALTTSSPSSSVGHRAPIGRGRASVASARSPVASVGGQPRQRGVDGVEERAASLTTMATESGPCSAWASRSRATSSASAPAVGEDDALRRPGRQVDRHAVADEPLRGGDVGVPGADDLVDAPDRLRCRTPARRWPARRRRGGRAARRRCGPPRGCSGPREPSRVGRRGDHELLDAGERRGDADHQHAAGVGGADRPGRRRRRGRAAASGARRSRPGRCARAARRAARRAGRRGSGGWPRPLVAAPSRAPRATAAVPDRAGVEPRVDARSAPSKRAVELAERVVATPADVGDDGAPTSAAGGAGVAGRRPRRPAPRASRSVQVTRAGERHRITFSIGTTRMSRAPAALSAGTMPPQLAALDDGVDRDLRRDRPAASPSGRRGPG